MTKRVLGLLLMVVSVLFVGACGSDRSAPDGAPAQSQNQAFEPSAAQTQAASPSLGSEASAPAQAAQGGNVQTIQVQVVGGLVHTASREVSVPVGTLVRLEVTSEIADELHVHGYEQRMPVSAGAPAVLEFAADIPGQFEVELEQSQTELVQLRVQ